MTTFKEMVDTAVRVHRERTAWNLREIVESAGMTHEITIPLPQRSSLTASGLSGGVTEERWQRTPFFCPHCGASNTVWTACADGDYYVGERHLCTTCTAVFYLPSGTKAAEPDSPDLMRIKAIVAALASQPDPYRSKPT